ncbi:MAG TPA: hypothetical protein VEQ60_01665 [Longimicrobium sp.]|nr:hypothetical protein [Longimicrobium sp.]
MRSYDNSVFINCPFDSTYRPLFEAVAFAVYDCGFYPRTALEVEDSSEVRMDKIVRLIAECRLAVHDVSRTQLDRDSRLPRFNMPLELGIFIGAKEFGEGEQRRKAAVVLDTERYRYQRYISDIAGSDIRAHGRAPGRAIHQVRSFLSTHCADRSILPGGEMIAARYAAFRRGLARACEKLHLRLDELTFRDLTTLMVAWLDQHPLAQAA